MRAMEGAHFMAMGQRKVNLDSRRVSCYRHRKDRRLGYAIYHRQLTN